MQFLFNNLKECGNFSQFWLIFHTVSIRGLDNHVCIFKLMYPTPKMQFQILFSHKWHVSSIICASVLFMKSLVYIVGQCVIILLTARAIIDLSVYQEFIISQHCNLLRYKYLAINATKMCPASKLHRQAFEIKSSGLKQDYGFLYVFYFIFLNILSNQKALSLVMLKLKTTIHT